MTARSGKNVDRGVGERLAETLRLAGLSQDELAKRARGSVRGVQDNVAGKTMPGGRVLAALGDAGVNIHYVLTGRPPKMLIQGAYLHDDGFKAEEPGVGAGRGYAEIPLLDVRARGGTGGELVGDEAPQKSLAFREDWIRQELRVRPSDLRLIYVIGDSMEPDLRSGDIILIDHTDTAARREAFYVLRMDGALLVKLLQRLPGGVIRVISKNELYEPFSIKAEDLEHSNDIAIVGRVVWACRRY